MTVVFLHVQKTAGSSLTSMLAANFEPKRVCHPEPHGELKGRTAHELAAFDFIYGHFDWSQLEAVPGPKQIVSLLREPVQRVLSLYWYWRSYSWAYAEETISPGVKYAKDVGIEEFFGNNAPPGIRANFDNAMVRQFVGARFWKPYFGFTISDAEALELAKRRIDEMVFCGTTEQFDATAAAIFRKLGLPMATSRRDNTLAQRIHDANYDLVQPTPPSAELLARLRQLTALDTRLYHYVRRRWPMRRAVLSHAIRSLGRPAIRD